MSTTTKKARILLIDIETAPAVTYTWGRFRENIGQSQVVRDGYVLCACWKWLGEPGVNSVAIPDRRVPNSTNDDYVVKKVWKLLDEADVVIGHNVRSFDAATMNARFLVHRLSPPSPYRFVDTLESVKKKFRFASNSLACVSESTGIGAKIHTDFSLWRGCMDGNRLAWKRMIRYCKHDVALLERGYLLLRGWIDNHPNVSLYSSEHNVCCPKCGSTKLHRRGEATTNTFRYQRYQCQKCGGWARGRKNTMDKDERELVITNAATG